MPVVRLWEAFVDMICSYIRVHAGLGALTACCLQRLRVQCSCLAGCQRRRKPHIVRPLRLQRGICCWHCLGHSTRYSGRRRGRVGLHRHRSRRRCCRVPPRLGRALACTLGCPRRPLAGLSLGSRCLSSLVFVCIWPTAGRRRLWLRLRRRRRRRLQDAGPAHLRSQLRPSVAVVTNCTSCASLLCHIG